jgi:hypothetical protein
MTMDGVGLDTWLSLTGGVNVFASSGSSEGGHCPESQLSAICLSVSSDLVAEEERERRVQHVGRLDAYRQEEHFLRSHSHPESNLLLRYAQQWP